MGAKQSKRSVDISGKEAESAGEVAAAGAGGEGRVEQLADADALKPQLNGDAHIHEQTEKQKELDSGTPENEKDATTEKEENQEEEKEVVPLTNGTESDQKVENGESTPVPEDGKKPKKEKVKKKWSLRSISFSRKDKPKQEKKQKDEEPKTNGEPEKVPEETAEIASESAVTATADEAKTESEDKEEKTPETPVTEPITNGSSTPETPKVDSPVVEEPAAPSLEPERPEPQSEIQPDQLPVNGLSLDETAKETPAIEKIEESKEEPVAVTTEIVPPEISVKKEVCVEQMPLIDSTPPPLPANPPPSSVASFAATTMAPESTDASLANTADNAISPPSIDPISKDKLDELPPNTENELTKIQTVSDTPPLKEVSKETPVLITQTDTENEPKEEILNAGAHVDNDLSVQAENVSTEGLLIQKVNSKIDDVPEITEMEIPATETENELPVNKTDISNFTEDLPSPPSPISVDEISTEKVILEDAQATKDIVVNSNHISNVEEISAAVNEIVNDNKNSEQNVKTKSKDSLGNLIEAIECNGNIEQEKLATENEANELIPPISPKEIPNIEYEKATTPDDSLPPSLSEANSAAGAASNDESESFPLPPSELCRPESPAEPQPTTQDPISVTDKLAELIPEVPEVPELKTETLQETTSDLAVAN